ESANESADAPTPPPLSSAHKASTDKGDEPDHMADGRAALAPREVSETPQLSVGKSTSSGEPHTSVSPRPQSRSPIPVEPVTRLEWSVRKILDSRIRKREGKAILEYLVVWEPTWQLRRDLILGCHALIEEFHAKWGDERPSTTMLERHERFDAYHLPSIPADRNGVTTWLIKRILNSRIRVRGGQAILEYLVAWRPTWQPRSDLIPGCEGLVGEYHEEWKDKRPSLTTLAGYRHFKQRRRPRKGNRYKIVKSSG
ncbi:hypothetical protein I7I51_08811, partial [Histoplasma capsulatum]